MRRPRIRPLRRAKEEAKSKGKPEEKATPKAKMQYNFTDPESRIMPGADGFVQAYNAQIADAYLFQLNYTRPHPPFFAEGWVLANVRLP